MVKARLIGGALLAVTASLDIVSAVQSDDRRYRVTVLQSTARRPDPADVTRVFARADEVFGKLAGQRFVRLAFADVGRGVPIEKVQEYIKAHPAEVPDGFLVLSDDEEAMQYGGYSFVVPRPDGDRNRFPNSHGDGLAYVAVIDFFRKSKVRSGPNAEPDYVTACLIVHELSHPFGEVGDDDHYRGQVCRDRMNFTPAQATETAAQEHCGICPDVFAALKQVR